MIDEIAIKRITIPLPFRLDHVHCFLAEGENGWTIIDAGLNTDVSKEVWAPIIEQHQINKILITHYHPDHFGYAGTLQTLTNAKVWMTETDATAGLTFWEPQSLKGVKGNYAACGIPFEFSEELTSDEASFHLRVKPYPEVNHYIEEGMKFVLGKHEYEVIFTPGHSDGLITLYNKERNLLLSTDHILPKISPNISYWFRGNPNPLASFFTSLEKIKRLHVEYVIPSHGEPFMDANKRIDELLSHHEERLQKVHDYIQSPGTIFEVTGKLFKKLTTHEMRFAIGETLAHLEYLRLNQKCKKWLEKGNWYYEAN